MAEPNFAPIARYCGRPSNPVFCAKDQMRKQELAVFEKWQTWAIFQMLIAYRGSAVFSVTKLSPLDDARRFLYALHDGMKYFAARETRPRPMPAIPALWPNDFPFELVWSFVEILQKEMDRYAVSAAANEVKMESMG
ncbi:hypothetical protein GFL88_19335 [Rhizobium leguminosarum bv. viciae]|uniref:hypothetical protein n=1 Tax=Rhizobium leguminosarum TaxID=384 RepID=UPI0014429028|nr:hypothetical protein [Rhizobium leguminosarum]NKK65644.1 hypothetical protein [Rhizobium leguminosarum bv. viciae]